MLLRPWILFVATVLVLWTGCGRKRSSAPDSGSYGSVTNILSTNVSRALPDRSPEQPWTNGELSVIQTELSPATLWHSRSSNLSFFANMPRTGLGGPTFVAMETQQGPKIFRPGEVIDPARMRESWFVAWWAGATNWTQWDSPWFVTLQRRPLKIQFDTNGLHFTFPHEAGYAALMPLYGYYKPLQAGQESSPFALLKAKKKRVLTWEWFRALPADPLARAMYWASALKEFPLYCEDSFSVDRARDTVVLRQKIRFLSWDDEWNTKHLKLAPVSPVLALAFREGFPAEFSKKPFDMEIFTAYGPLYGIEGVEDYTVTLPVMRYVNETPGAGTNATSLSNAPCYLAWQIAHGRGDWEDARRRWPALRGEFQKKAEASWAAFGLLRQATPFEEAADSLGAARVAYRLGDIDAYADASQMFARAFVQLCAQQRGLNYFRQNQPWKSMDPIGPNAALGRLTDAGWELTNQVALGELTNSPDAERVWRASLPPAGTPSPKAEVVRERLIPADSPAPYLPGMERRVAEANSFLLQNVVLAEGRWPCVSWPDWTTPSGAAWSFGEVEASDSAVATRAETIPLNWNTRVVVLPVSR